VHLAWGAVSIPFIEILKIALGYPVENTDWLNIFRQIRLPRTLTAIVVGSALGVSGLLMQTFFRNPLAEPAVLGITAGASLGVAFVRLGVSTSLGITLFLDSSMWVSWSIISASVMGSALVLSIVLMVALRIQDNTVLLILGIMIGNLTFSIVSIWQYFSSPEQLQDFLLWSMGSIKGVDLAHWQLLAGIVCVGLVGAFLSAKPLNALLLGENYARSMGVSLAKVRFQVIIIVSLLSGSITAFCGPIGFIGIAVPHLIKNILPTTNHRALIPAVAVGGAVLLLACDIVAKLSGSQVSLPLNAVTALVGAPVVIAVILRK
jgi:iron complex transport system permease protein